MVPRIGASTARAREAKELANPQFAVEMALSTPLEAMSLKKMGMTVVMIIKTNAEFATSYRIQLFSALDIFLLTSTVFTSFLGFHPVEVFLKTIKRRITIYKRKVKFGMNSALYEFINIDLTKLDPIFWIEISLGFNISWDEVSSTVSGLEKDMTTKQKKLSKETEIVHGIHTTHSTAGDLAPPIHMTTAFKFKSANRSRAGLNPEP